MLTVRQLRDRIAAGVTTAIGSTWVESRYPPEMFGLDTRDQRHHAFSVGVPSTIPASLDRQSARGGATQKGAVSATEVVVRWGYRLRADAQATDYALSLDAEAQLVAALLALDANPNMAIRLLNLRRVVIASVLNEDESVEGTITLECLHRLPLA